MSEQPPSNATAEASVSVPDLEATFAELLAQPRRPDNPPDEAFRPRVTIKDNELTIVTEPTVGTTVDLQPSDIERILRDADLEPGQWDVGRYDYSRWQKQDGTWLYSHKLSASPTGPTFGSELPDLDDLERAVARLERRIPEGNGSHTTLVVVVSDEQFGKVDTRGGAKQTVARYRYHRERVMEEVRRYQPGSIKLLLPGDVIENFESTGSQDRTNDLSLTEQIRLSRRMTWETVEMLAAEVADLEVATVPSNHSSVRRGKANLDVPGDDFGVEILSQVEDMASVNPDLYGHVRFSTPGKFEEALCIDTTSGVRIGLVHGHQKGKQGALDDWWAGQAFGRTPVGAADILVHGHFHNANLSTTGDDRWRIGAPTLDSGSSWFGNISGHESRSAMLTFTVDEFGWDNLRLR